MLLQLLIRMAEGSQSEVVANGNFDIGGKTGDAIEGFQKTYGLPTDRNFGPLTRGVFLKVFGVDVNSLSVEALTEPTVNHGSPETEEEIDVDTAQTMTDAPPLEGGEALVAQAEVLPGSVAHKNSERESGGE